MALAAPAFICPALPGGELTSFVPKDLAISTVPSWLPPSTTMTSTSGTPCVLARVSAILSPSLSVGMIMEILFLFLTVVRGFIQLWGSRRGEAIKYETQSAKRDVTLTMHKIIMQPQKIRILVGQRWTGIGIGVPSCCPLIEHP